MAVNGDHYLDIVPGFLTMRLRWERTAVSTADNTSTISWRFQLVSLDNGAVNSGASKDWSVTINGVKKSGQTIIGIGNNATRTLASGTQTIAHNADGSKTVSFAYSLGVQITFQGQFIGTKSRSGSFTLDTIARASQPSLVTWPETTQNVGAFGQTFSIHMNRADSSFTHTVRYEYGKRTGTIATGVGTGTTWAVPAEFMNDIPNASSGSGRIYVDTYSGSTLIGTKYTGFTATVPATVKPSVEFALRDVTEADRIYGSPVQGLSKIQIVANATPAFSSPIVSSVITANGTRYSGTTAETDYLHQSGQVPVSVTVTDQRGRTGSASYNMTVQAYTPPAVTELSVHRANADGSENAQGEYIRVRFSAQITSLGNKNQARYSLRYKKTTSDSWTSANLGGLDDNFSPAGYSYIFAADESSSYDIEVTAADRHNSTTRATSASTAFSLMDWHPSGTGLRFGGVAELENTLQNDLELRQVGNRYTFNSPGEAGVAGFVCLASIEITAANADTPITFILTRRQALTDMKVTIRFSNPTATASSLSSIRYEGTNYGAFLVQVSPMVWDLYVQKGSAYDTLAIQDWYTSRTMADRINVTFPGTLVDTVPQPYHRATPAVVESILDCFMPVGYVLTLYSHADPNTMYPGTTWVRITNAFLWAVDASGTIGLTGGAKEVALTVDQIPAHSHGSVYSQHSTGTKDKAWYNTSGTAVAYGPVTTGGGQAHNNMPPYVQVSIWRRTA